LQQQELKPKTRKASVASVVLLVLSLLASLLEERQVSRNRQGSHKLQVGLLMELQELVGHFLELRVLQEEETLLQVDLVM